MKDDSRIERLISLAERIIAALESDIAILKQGGAQVLATALSVYVTNATLDPTLVAQGYGFKVSGTGLGTTTFGVGCGGAAFGVANGTTMTVIDLLRATDAQVVHGRLYNGDDDLRREARDLYTDLLQAGNIH